MIVNNLDVPIRSVMKDVEITISLSGLKVFRARWWLAVQFFKLGSKIAGCSVRTIGDPVKMLESRGWWAAADDLRKLQNGDDQRRR